MRETRREETALYFNAPTGTFFLLFEQGGPHFHFALGPANYVVGPVWKACCQDASSQNAAAVLGASPSHMERARVGAPVNSPAQAQPLGHPSTGDRNTAFR